MVTLYRRFERVRSRDLAPREVLKFTDGRWRTLNDAQKALTKIRRKYLNEDELILLDLLSMAPPKTNLGISDILKVNPETVRRRKRRLYEMIVAYGWWLQNEDHVQGLVLDNLSRLHLEILLPVIIDRRYQHEIVDELGVTTWCVHKKVSDCLVLLEPVPDWVTFVRSLKMRYYT